MTTEKVRDHLFISYASEDRALAEWLTLRLTVEGYRVWCDRFKMLGGESFPKEIDRAIKNQTFRLLALLSRYSLEKPNPTKERTLALNIGKERNVDFMIPLVVGELKPTELNWMESDLSSISFANWAEGLQQLIKKLRSIDAPRPIEDVGKKFATDILLPTDVVLDKAEILYTNCLKFESIPEKIFFFKFGRVLSPSALDSLSDVWAFYPLDEKSLSVFAFEPPIEVANISCEQVGEFHWREIEKVEGILSVNIVSNLLRQALNCKLIEKGLRRNIDTKRTYFPNGLVKKDKLYFMNHNGRRVPVQVTGMRKFRGQYFCYHLAPAFGVKQGITEDFVAQLKVRLFLTDINESPLDVASALVRRKTLTKNWFNHEWLSRQLAICAYLSEDTGKIYLGRNLGSTLVLESIPIRGEVPVSINEQLLEPLRATRPPSNDSFDDGEEMESQE